MSDVITTNPENMDDAEFAHYLKEHGGSGIGLPQYDSGWIESLYNDSLSTLTHNLDVLPDNCLIVCEKHLFGSGRNQYYFVNYYSPTNKTIQYSNEAVPSIGDHCWFRVQIWTLTGGGGSGGTIIKDLIAPQDFVIAGTWMGMGYSFNEKLIVLTESQFTNHIICTPICVVNSVIPVEAINLVYIVVENIRWKINVATGNKEAIFRVSGYYPAPSPWVGNIITLNVTAFIKGA
jgi:hypothetical protein